MRRNIFHLVLAVLLITLFSICLVSCYHEPTGEKEVSLITLDGKAYDSLQKALDDATEGDTIRLGNGTIKMEAPIYIEKGVNVIGTVGEDGTILSVIDYGTKLFEKDFCKGEKYSSASWAGAVNVFSGGVRIENVKISGDIDYARKLGAVSDFTYAESSGTDIEANYKPVFALDIDPCANNQSEASFKDIENIPEPIVIKNVEITKATAGGLFANHVGIFMKDSDGVTVKIDDKNTPSQKLALSLIGLNIHDNGDIEATKYGCPGVFLRNSTNILMKDSTISTEDNGAPVWIHSSEFRGPYTLKNNTLSGKYRDDLDYSFCFQTNKKDVDAGAFKDVEAPIIFEANWPFNGDTTLYNLLNNSKTDVFPNSGIICPDYGLNNDTVIPSNTPQRYREWGGEAKLIALTPIK